jgi:hypothetical protein
MSNKEGPESDQHKYQDAACETKGAMADGKRQPFFVLRLPGTFRGHEVAPYGALARVAQRQRFPLERNVTLFDASTVTDGHLTSYTPTPSHDPPCLPWPREVAVVTGSTPGAILARARLLEDCCRMA